MGLRRLRFKCPWGHGTCTRHAVLAAVDRRRWLGVLFHGLILSALLGHPLLFPHLLWAQQASAGADATIKATVHGVVLNGEASGEPLSRALVRLTGESSAGALMTAKRRFELSNPPTGPQQISVIKPGFLDVLGGRPLPVAGNSRGSSHTPVMVAARCPMHLPAWSR